MKATTNHKNVPNTPPNVQNPRAKLPRVPQPIGDRILVKRDDPVDVTPGGIALPQAAREVPRKGLVVEIGEGRTLDNGERSTFSVRRGDRIMFSNYAGTEITFEDETFIIMREEDVLAKLPN